MNDIEISKALALVIGWNVLNNKYCQDCWVWTGGNWKIFDYRDWNVIGPIAERYRCFPLGTGSQWASRTGTHVCMYADTPQRAIAMAVIAGAKK